MTVETFNQQGGAVAAAAAPDMAPVVYNKHVTDLVAWAQQAQAARQYADLVVYTNFCPQQYRQKPDEAAAAILAGGELGFSPMASLRTFDNIQGVASPKAITQRAVVQSHGHDIWTVEKTAARCVVAGRRKGSEQVQTSEWTIERAELAGFVKKNPNYKTQPEAMLLARATSECARMVASDALLGIPYSSEELVDDHSLRAPEPGQGALPSPRAAARGGTTMSARALTGGDGDTAGSVTKDQLGRIKEAFTEAGITDRTVIARIVNQLSDVEVAKATDLTEAGADKVLERLHKIGAQGIQTAANPQPVDEPDVEQVDDADVTDDVEGHDPADDAQGTFPVEEPPAWPETTQPGAGGRKK